MQVLKKSTACFLMFVTMFVITVSASAEEIINPNYLGIYKNSANSKSFISIKDTGFVLNAVKDGTTGAYVRGSTNVGFITSSEFGCEFDVIKRCDSDGNYLGDNIVIWNYGIDRKRQRLLVKDHH